MLGAIIGDVSGSRYEWGNLKSKDFPFLTARCRLTDDSVMTLAVAKAILQHKEDGKDLGRAAADCMQEFGRRYPDAGYGGRFRKWIFAKAVPIMRPYSSG